MLWNDESITLEEFDQRLKQDAARAPQPHVSVMSAPGVGYQDFVPVFRLLQASGLAKVGVIGGT